MTEGNLYFKIYRKLFITRFGSKINPSIELFKKYIDLNKSKNITYIKGDSTRINNKYLNTLEYDDIASKYIEINFEKEGYNFIFNHQRIEELIENDLYDKVSQAFVALFPVKSVGVMGDKRTYEYIASIRAVITEDFMTATWAHLPYEFLEKVSNRIVNEVPGINRVVYDISSKPASTIEYE